MWSFFVAVSFGDPVQVVGAVLDLRQPEGDALQGGAVRAGFRQEEGGLLGVGEHELDVLVGLQLDDPLEVVDHIAGALQFLHHHGPGGQLGQVDGAVHPGGQLLRPPAPIHRREFELCVGDGLTEVGAVHLDEVHSGLQIVEKHQFLGGRLARFQLDLLGGGGDDVGVVAGHLFHQIGAGIEVEQLDHTAFRRGLGVEQLGVLID